MHLDVPAVVKYYLGETWHLVYGNIRQPVMKGFAYNGVCERRYCMIVDSTVVCLDGRADTFQVQRPINSERKVDWRGWRPRYT